MSRKFLVNLIAAIVVAVVAGTAAIFAWYTNTKKTSPVDIETNGVSISYKINSDDTVNSEEFDVNNVSFFDIYSENEAYYLPSMAVCMKFNVVNYSSTDVNVTLKQDTQSYHLGTEITSGVISVYKYTSVSIGKSAFVANTHFTYDNDTYEYSAPEAYVSGTKYFTRELIFTATPTVASSKVTAVALSNVPTGKSYTVALDKDGLGFAVEEYVEVTNLTEDEFNLNGSVYYTLSNGTYTVANVYSGTTYYEVKTVAYLSEFTISDSTITEVSYSVTGSYITCVIADSSKLTSSDGTYVLPSVASANRYTTSVNSYLSTNSLSHSFTTSSKLSKGALSTAGGSVDLYVYVYGVQPYDGATNNFLNNDNNVYPISLIIEAE